MYTRRVYKHHNVNTLNKIRCKCNVTRISFCAVRRTVFIEIYTGYSHRGKNEHVLEKKRESARKVLG